MKHRTRKKVDQAILLVAGRGSRLAPLTDTTPKCLLEVGGEALLVRLLRQLKAAGIEHAVMVTGYLKEKLEAAVDGVDGLPKLTFVFNERWDSANNAESLRVGMEALEPGRFILLDGDLLVCDSEMILDLVTDRRDNVIGASLQLPRNLGEEEMKFQLEPIDVAWGARRVTTMSKQLNPRLSHGESMGMQVVGESLFSDLLTSLRNLNEAELQALYYEDVFARLIQHGNAEFYANAVDPTAWIEIDTAEDLDDARAKFATWEARAAG